MHIVFHILTALICGFCKQDCANDMTEYQLQMFWDKFKTLEKHRAAFAKPPVGWKPPEFRDMDQSELQAYWEGFRAIVNQTIPEVEENHDSESVCHGGDVQQVESLTSTIQKQHPHPDDDDPMTRVVAAAISTPAPVMIRVRSKSSPKEVQERALRLNALEAARVKSASKRRRAVDGGDPGKKRKYVPKAKISREGKKSTVSIWMKVQLCKDPRLLNS